MLENVTTAEIPVAVREAIAERAGHYSVCVLGACGDPDDGHYRFCGSATLASWSGQCVLVTAAHVWEEVDKCEGVGLTIAPEHHGFIQPKEAFLARPVCGTEFGPWTRDLCFVTVPPNLIPDIKARKSLYNLDHHRKQFLGGEEGLLSEFSHCVVIGAPAEMSQVQEQQASMTMVTMFSKVVERPTVAEWDFVEVEVLRSDRLALPESYGGVSGGGLWAFSLAGPPYTESSWDGRLLLADVAFYQTSDEGHGRRLQCQGPRSLYAALDAREPL